MTIKEYIIKNLPNFNWNILPQIFAENGVEMNEEIEAYLKETPGNTNWSILEQLGENGSDIILPAKIIINTNEQAFFLEGSSFTDAASAYNFVIAHKIDVGDGNYEIPLEAFIIEDIAPQSPCNFNNPGGYHEDVIYWTDGATGDALALYPDRIEYPTI